MGVNDQLEVPPRKPLTNVLLLKLIYSVTIQWHTKLHLNEMLLTVLRYLYLYLIKNAIDFD